jgi:hypothetical protein
MKGETKAAIQHLAKAGILDEIIAERLACSVSYVRYVRGQMGIFRKPHQVRDKSRLTQINGSGTKLPHSHRSDRRGP